MYTYLQKLAVGLEQVALDQIIFDGRYDEEFNLAEYRLKGVSYFHKSNNKGRINSYIFVMETLKSIEFKLETILRKRTIIFSLILNNTSLQSNTVCFLTV